MSGGQCRDTSSQVKPYVLLLRMASRRATYASADARSHAATTSDRAARPAIRDPIVDQRRRLGPRLSTMPTPPRCHRRSVDSAIRSQACDRRHAITGMRSRHAITARRCQPNDRGRVAGPPALAVPAIAKRDYDAAAARLRPTSNGRSLPVSWSALPAGVTTEGRRHASRPFV